MGEEHSPPDQNRGWAGAVRPVAAWTGLIAATASQIYLVLLLTLAVIAVLPLVFGWHATVVQSGSMRPHIDTGDVVILAPWSPDQPVPMGGVVQYSTAAAAEPDHAAGSRLHRIVAANDDGTVVTAGDANAEPDSTPLNPEHITGQARVLVPYVGLPSHWAQTGQWTPLSLWVAGTLAALVLAYAGLLRRPDAVSVHGDSDAPSGSIPDTPRDEPLPEQSIDRRHALLGAGLLLALPAAATLSRAQPVAATFTARTSTAGNTWTVASAPPTPSPTPAPAQTPASTPATTPTHTATPTQTPTSAPTSAPTATSTSTPAPRPTLGRAGDYVLLAHSRIQNNANSTIVGNIATSPGTTIDGFGSRDVITGSIDKDTPSARNAKTDAVHLDSTLTALPVTEQRPPVLAGTVRPGIYTSTTGQFSISRTLTLDAEGNPEAQFIFRADQLLMDNIGRIEFTGGALAANVFFHCTSLRTKGVTDLRGVFVASHDVLLDGVAELHGHLIALNDSITIDGRFRAQSP